MAAESEADRLRALLTLMREFSVTKLVTEGLTVECSPFAFATSVPPTVGANGKGEPDDDEGDEDEKSLKARWRAHWERLTLSSGSGIPPFPGNDRALRTLGPRS